MENIEPIAIADVTVNYEEMNRQLEVLEFKPDITNCLIRKNECNQGLYLIIKNEDGRFLYTPFDAHEIVKYANLKRIQCEPIYFEDVPWINSKDPNDIPKLISGIGPTNAAKNYFKIKILCRESQEREHGPIYTFLELLDNPAWK